MEFYQRLSLLWILSKTEVPCKCGYLSTSNNIFCHSGILGFLLLHIPSLFPFGGKRISVSSSCPHVLQFSIFNFTIFNFAIFNFTCFERNIEKEIRKVIDVSEMQFGFRNGRGIIDAIFIARQLQELK